MLYWPLLVDIYVEKFSIIYLEPITFSTVHVVLQIQNLSLTIFFGKFSMSFGALARNLRLQTKQVTSQTGKKNEVRWRQEDWLDDI